MGTGSSSPVPSCGAALPWKLAIFGPSPALDLTYAHRSALRFPLHRWNTSALCLLGYFPLVFPLDVEAQPYCAPARHRPASLILLVPACKRPAPLRHWLRISILARSNTAWCRSPASLDFIFSSLRLTQYFSARAQRLKFEEARRLSCASLSLSYRRSPSA